MSVAQARRRTRMSGTAAGVLLSVIAWYNLMPSTVSGAPRVESYPIAWMHVIVVAVTFLAAVAAGAAVGSWAANTVITAARNRSVARMQHHPSPY